jgi:hypothetical protein
MYTLPMSHDYPRIAEYSLYRWALLHTTKVCARKSLQDCSMVSSSLLHTHWGFTAGVSITPTQKPPLVPCGFQPSQLYPHHPTVPPSQLHQTSQRFAISASPHSRLVRQDKTLPHTMPGHTHIGSWLYCFHGWSLHEPVLRFGHDN